MSALDAEYPMPFHAGRYVLDTGDLLAVHHGCYLMLILHYWKNGPLPARLSDLAIICKMEPRTFADTVWPKLKRFFPVSADRLHLHNKRLDIERAKRDAPKAPRKARAKAMRVSADGPEFDAFWHAYPKKVGRGAALKAFLSASKRAEVPAIMAGLAQFLKNLPREMQFIPHAATWLNQDRWTDEHRKPDAAPAPQGPPSPRAGGISQEEAARLGL